MEGSAEGCEGKGSGSVPQENIFENQNANPAFWAHFGIVSQKLCFCFLCTEVGPRSTILDLRGTRWPMSQACGHDTHVQSTKIKVKFGGESGVDRAAPVLTTLQNQQLRRNAASRTCRTTLLCKIVSCPSSRTSAC